MCASDIPEQQTTHACGHGSYDNSLKTKQTQLFKFNLRIMNNLLSCHFPRYIHTSISHWQFSLRTNVLGAKLNLPYFMMEQNNRLVQIIPHTTLTLKSFQ